MARSVRVLLGVLVLFLASCSELAPPAETEAPGGTLAALAVVNDLFFSEYVEPGSGNSKALEIYNGTNAAIDLAAGGYSVQQFSNGASSAGLTINLTGTVASGDVYVVAHSSAAAEVLAVADQTSGAGLFNGDDAVVLRRGSTIIDVIGQVGTDPGSQWGSGLVSTADNTLRRKGTVCAGDADGSDAFDPATEWDGFAQNTFDGLGAHEVAEDCEPGEPTDPGGDGPGGDAPDPETCDEPAHLIHDIQGPDATSPIVGATVTIEGVVVGDFQTGDGDAFDLEGFYVQEEDADADDDPRTSEGIFVFDSGTDVAVGDKVRVTGKVAEFFDRTEVSDVETVIVCGTADLPAATIVDLPFDDHDEVETYEGMLVTFPQDLVISEYFNFGRFGEIVLSLPPGGADLTYQPTSYLDPDDPALGDVADLIQRSIITLDDGLGDQNPAALRHPNGEEFSLSNSFRGGDTVTNATGVIDYSFSLYRIQPTEAADYTAVNERPLQPDAVGGSLRVAAFNVLNYFDTLDQGPDVCGVEGDEECRGADTAEELERQRAKIVAALTEIDAHVVGLIEIENDADQGALLDLVDGLNAATAPDTYAHVDTGGFVGPDVIKVALIYQPAFVTPIGSAAVLDDPAFLDSNDTGEPRNRAAVAQTFQEVDGGGRLTVVVNHFKSKGSGCGAGDDDAVQGNCNVTRITAAQGLLEWLADDPTGAGDPDFLLVGDFNSYDHEDPIDVLLAGYDGAAGGGDDYTDLLKTFEGEDAYSYVFDGQFGYLDYAISSASLTSQVTGATAWHINADEPSVIDYDTSFKPAPVDDIFAPDPYRSSDHDPVIVGLDLEADAPSCNAVSASAANLWPPNGKMRTVYLTVTDPQGDAVTLNVGSVFQDEQVGSAADAVIRPGGEVQLRAEREGNGDGRVYHVAFTATDGVGSCSGVVTVGVPHNQSRKGQPVDGGPLFDSTAP